MEQIVIVGFLWRLPSTGPSEAVIRDALGRDPRVLQVSTETDIDSGELFVGFFVPGRTAKEAIETARAAIRDSSGGLLESVPTEWSGIAVPTPDPERPETFPPIPTLSQLRARRMATPGASRGLTRKMRVIVIVEQLRGVSVDEALRGLRGAADKLTVATVVDVRLEQVTRIALELMVNAADKEQAANSGYDAVEALIAAALPPATECAIRVDSIDGASASRLH
jgi:hypothetical protein